MGSLEGAEDATHLAFKEGFQFSVHSSLASSTVPKVALTPRFTAKRWCLQVVDNIQPWMFVAFSNHLARAVAKQAQFMQFQLCTPSRGLCLTGRASKF